MNFLQGKKTYIVAATFLCLALVPVIWGVVIPEFVWGILAAVGLASIRAALQDISGNAGWKTYLSAAAVAVISVLSGIGIVIPPDIAEIMYGIFGALGLAGIRDAVKKLD